MTFCKKGDNITQKNILYIITETLQNNFIFIDKIDENS